MGVQGCVYYLYIAVVVSPDGGTRICPEDSTAQTTEDVRKPDVVRLTMLGTVPSIFIGPPNNTDHT